MAQDHISTNATHGGGLLDLRPARWALIYGLPAVVALLAGSAIFVSRMSVTQDVRVLTQERWCVGRPAAVRVVAYGDSGRPLEQLDVTLSLEGEGRETMELAKASAGGLPATDVRVDVPDWPDGRYKLRALVRSSIGLEPIQLDVELMHELSGEGVEEQEENLYLPQAPPDRAGPFTTKVTVSDVVIELLPHGAGLVPSLNNLLFLRTTDKAGRPVSTRVALKLVGGQMAKALPEVERTDELGLSVFSVYPMSNEVMIEATLADADGPGDRADAGVEDADGGFGTQDGGSVSMASRLTIPTTPAQMVMRLDQPVPEALEPFTVRIQSLHGARPLYTDAYVDGLWVGALSGRFQQGRSEVTIPGLPEGLALLQTYLHPINVGYAYSAHHVYLSRQGQSDAAVLEAIATELERRQIDAPYVASLRDQGLFAKTDRFELTAAFLLSRLDQGFYRPPLSISSAEVRSAELVSFQRSFRYRISVAIGVIGVVVALLLAYAFSVAAYRAREQRRMLEEDIGADESDLYVTSMGRPVGLDRFRAIMQIALMVGVVATGFILIAALVSVLNWQ